MKNIEKHRNIGISAHIDSGKTTLTERILYFTTASVPRWTPWNLNANAASRFSPLLRLQTGPTPSLAKPTPSTSSIPRGTWTSRSKWNVLSACSTVLSSCSPAWKVFSPEKLNHKPCVMQIPIGLEDQLKGVVDLVEMKAYYFEGANGDDMIEKEIPAELVDQANEYREKLIDCCADYSDEIMEKAMEGQYGVDEIDKNLIKATIRKATISLEVTPVFMGSAHKNVGVQKLLDGVIDYLPNPTEVENKALDLEGDMITNMATGKKVSVGRLVRMHADEMVDITEAGAGDIVALFGIDCASGTTFTDGKNHYNMTSMHVPNPVIELVIEAKNRDDLDNMSKALNRFTKEDPTFQVEVDKESGQTIIKGMGELHLDVYIERMRREYKCDVTTGAPQVAYRETITRPAKFDYTHKKQTGGSGQYAKVVGEMRPMAVEGDQEKVYNFVNSVVGGRIPKEYIPSCDKGFQSCMEAGSLIGFPVVGIEMEVQDGAYHPVDSSDMAFQVAARMAFREAFEKAGAQILEPIMKVEIQTPTEFQGSVVGNVSQRRGTITGTSEELGMTTITAEVPLSEMFGYATDLRSMTQGKAEFTMEFCKYLPVPKNIQEELIKKYGDKAKARA